MKKMNMILTVAELYPDCMTIDGYDDCIIGVASRFGMSDCVAYDRNKIIKKLEQDGMSLEEAEEFFEYNILGAWVGETTPIFIDDLTCV